jgi:hypothetical protein
MTSPLLPGLAPPTNPDAGVTVQSVLRTLSKERLLDVARDHGLTLSPRDTIANLARDAERSRQVDLPGVLSRLLRDELRKALEAHGLDPVGRARLELADRLLAHSAAPPVEATPDFAPDPFAPAKGRLAVVRQRQYLITDVVPPPAPAHATATRPAERVRLVCLDDDAQGRDLEVFWPLELGARVIEPSVEGLGAITHLDDPAHFGAYLNTLRWNAISATDNALFQAPFRAGIQLLNHQIPPLSKALALPRANLFIADDVGLGKTIEAGLVLQELILRQQVERVLIVAPASITLQWRAEMEQRFGQRFEIMNRAFVARCRRERGFGVNPWAAHSRFIVSYQTLRRPEYLEPLLTRLGDRARRSLLILDEAHTVAPASPGRYAVDSNVTRTVRDLAGRFDNRLFLSATPHNGHSNSFSALLEILDSARFTRGVPIDDPAQLEPVLTRRLKSDLKAIGTKPTRTARSSRSPSKASPTSPPTPPTGTRPSTSTTPHPPASTSAAPTTPSSASPSSSPSTPPSPSPATPAAASSSSASKSACSQASRPSTAPSPSTPAGSTPTPARTTTSSTSPPPSTPTPTTKPTASPTTPRTPTTPTTSPPPPPPSSTPPPRCAASSRPCAP